MSLSAQTVWLMVGTAIASQIAAFLLNNLTPVREFPGKDILFLRMTACLTLVPALVALLGDKAVVGPARVACWVAVGAIAWALISDSQTLIKALRRATLRDEAERTAAIALGKAPKLRAELLAETKRRVRQRLRYAYGAQQLINLSMELAPEAIDGEAREGNVFLVPQPKQQVETFADSRFWAVKSETTILDTFDDPDIAGQLLILGAPGSGKTTALLKLADELLDRAKQSRKIPYIFELSAWRDDKQDIAVWLMAQLKFEHNIDEAVSRQWIVDGDLLPLLDGLDELGTERRQACIEKINEFVTGQLGRQVVVCCRTKVYEASDRKLDTLNGALRIQPLEISQVRAYFEQVNPEIWEALQDEDGLGELLKRPEPDDEPALLQIPLFLQILAIAYQRDRKISAKSELIDSYISRRLSLQSRKSDRLLARKKEPRKKWAFKVVDYEPTIESTNLYLGWLARKLNQENLSGNFLIEQIQPSWLEGTQSRVFLPFSFSGAQYWLLSNLISIVVLGSPTFIVSTIFGRPLSGLAGGFVVALFPIAIGSMNVDWSHIERVEALQMTSVYKSRRKILKISLVSLPFNIIAILFIGFIFSATPDSTLSSPIGVFWSSLLVFLIWFLMVPVGFAKEELKVRHIPNQGILASARNFFLSFASMCFACGLVGSIYNYLIDEPMFPSSVGSIGLIFSSIPCFYVFGGVSVVQHIALRLVLYKQGYIPFNYAKFLKYTTERRLTQQIGGSFRFIHRELLDHFAAMYDNTLEKT